MKKIISIILIVLMIIGIVALPNKSEATFTIDKADLYSKGTYSDYLRWGGMGLVFDYVVYQKDGQEYPAYCLNRDLKGANSGFSYSVDVNELLTDVEVWRTIINGYPYKTYQELGCANKEEAFMATKQAVYCALYDRDPNTYIATDEVGVRTRNALIQIVTNARNSTEVKQSADLTIEEATSKWEQDDISSKYVSKKFTVKANSTINTYLAELEGMNVEGAKIVDENNNEKTEFKYGESFKIIIPIKNMTDEGNFNIKVNGKVATKPILYGYSSDPTLQNYALTGDIYEDGSGIKTVYYKKNETKIIILKQDEEGNTLEGVKFRLLNENKDILYTELTTNKEGKIIIENLTPGTYYLEETSTVNGYAVYEEPIEAKVAYNEVLTITVTNSKETIEVEKPEITEKEQEVVVKLPKTGM
ncbi:MAG: Cys-Gln thioester bond-forming surface protein [Clostridia bacterium]|nr:Cys-Gln thioester bond-forming surface protein [Clostridia bacterium]